MKTLIVEEDRVAGIHLRRQLECFGHEATLVESAAAAWRLLQTVDFGLVLARWRLANMDAVELARRLRARGNTTSYVMLLFSRDPREDLLAALQAGVDDFLPWQCEREDLAARLAIAERTIDTRAELARAYTDLALMRADLARTAELNETYVDELRATCRELEAAHVELKAASITDGLTGLKNHREFQDRLEDEIHRAERYHLSLSLIMLDVDHFKRFNDTFGHPAGDEVLKSLAVILERQARVSDVVARYGGEEFAIILANTDREHAMAAAERLRAAIALEPWPLQPVTVSMGVATLRLVPQSRAELTAEADQALYACKAQGRNGVVHFSALREHA